MPTVVLWRLVAPLSVLAFVWRRLLFPHDRHRHHRLTHLGQTAARSADVCVFVGEKSAYGRRRALEAGMPAGNVHAVRFWQQVVDLLRGERRQGDLVLLRGTLLDHLSRVVFALRGSVECRAIDGGTRSLCDRCPELGFTPAGPVGAPKSTVAAGG